MIPAPSLIRAVERALNGGRLPCTKAQRADVLDRMKEVTEHGADGGFSGFTYYSDTCAFYERNQPEIIAMAKEYASDMGESLAAFVGSFRCLKDVGTTEDEIGATLYGPPMLREADTMVANALAWFALEEVSRFVVEGDES